MKIVYGIYIGRVSSIKQGLIGDSLDQQSDQNELARKRVETLNTCKIVIKKAFDFTASASGDYDMQPLLEAIDYCKDQNHKIKFAFIKSIDRITRGGATIYSFLKTEFAKAGVILVDSYGIISTQEVNTLEHLGVKFSWSVYSPSWKTELLEAERAQDEVRDILIRLMHQKNRTLI